VILVAAIIVGLLAGYARARYRGYALSVPDLRLIWLAALAFLPQWLVFYLPAVRTSASDELVALALVSSQALLLIFAWINRRQPAFWALGLGLACNLAVIVANGGLMPISPETVVQLGDAVPSNWSVGGRLGSGKDIVLPISETRLWWLSDHLLLPRWSSVSVAFSPGDVFIALGAAWFFWTCGGRSPSK
jgi:hypothetical protein